MSRFIGNRRVEALIVCLAPKRCLRALRFVISRNGIAKQSLSLVGVNMEGCASQGR